MVCFVVCSKITVLWSIVQQVQTGSPYQVQGQLYFHYQDHFLGPLELEVIEKKIDPYLIDEHIIDPC